ncbi:hypothetical protein A2U01_0087730, partial [Trifolium medium]|nr:hypothetical protein [Trifolium medium]
TTRYETDAWKIADLAISLSSSVLSLCQRILGVFNRSGAVDEGKDRKSYDPES